MGGEQMGSLGTPAFSESEAQTQARVYHYVHSGGEVNAPGVYRVLEGSRIFQAVEQAGGFTDDAASEYLNLAELTEDGMKIEVPSVEEVGNGEFPVSGDPAAAGGKGNINNATAQELMTLTGIGESWAAGVNRYREEDGGGALWLRVT